MTANDSLAFLSGGGRCGELVRSFDWARTPLGAPSRWPAALKTTVGILLHSRHPMFLWWGEDLVQIYNDSYLPSFGVGKHPAALGQRGADCWQEVWPVIKPQIDDVMQRGKASWNVDHLVPIWRNGRIEEVYWTYGYSPVYQEDGAIGGTLVVCTETTQRVVAQRRLTASRALALNLLEARTDAEISKQLLGCLELVPEDVPFAAIHAPGEPLVVTGLEGAALEALAHSLAEKPPALGLQRLDKAVPAGPWPEHVTDALVLPIEPARERVIIFGLSSRSSFDERYESFLQQVVDQVASALARTRTEGERRSLLEQAPVAAALLLGPEHVFEIANARYCEMVGRNVVGKPYLEAFPELRATELPAILDRVYRLGEAYVANEMAFPLASESGKVAEHFFMFNLEPVRSAAGSEIIGMMAIANDITTQVAARRVLEEAHRERARLLAEANAASRAKDEFLAMLGHELRNPLAPIITAVELMAAKAPDLLTRERAVIERQARHLVRLVDDLLDVARVAQGKIDLKRERLSASEIVSRAIEATSPILEAKHQLLSVDVPTDDLYVDGDAVRLCQVIANLLTNAVKYTPAGGRIGVTGARQGDDVVLTIQDNGIGIAEQQLPQLFEMFFQGQRNGDRSEGGLGLGLALVKTFVTLHGGTVRAQSAGIGKGSTFDVRLPVASDALEADARPAPAVLNRRRPAGLRVLVVDDNQDLAELLSSLLRAQGLEVRIASDAFTALELAQVFRPVVAILDIGLPVLDGYELGAQLRRHLGDRNLKLIAITGYGQPRNRERSRQAGFAAHLVKPVTSASLFDAIDAVTAALQPEPANS